MKQPELNAELDASNDSTTQEQLHGHTLLTVADVAKLIQCSERNVYRLCDGGRMPRPLKIGALIRWSRAVIDQWIADGCPPAREMRGRT